MRSTPHRILAALSTGLALLAAAAPAQAQLRVAATAGNLQYTLTDLAPDDGIAPSAVFDFPIPSVLASRTDIMREGAPTQYLWTDRASVDPVVLNQDLAAGAHTGMAFDGRTLVAAASLDPAAGAVLVDLRSQAAEAFRLSPRTRITFTLDAAVDLALDGQPDRRGHALAWAGMVLDHPWAGGRALTPYTPGLHAVSAWVGNDGWFGPADSQSGMADTITVSWDNDSAESLTGAVGYVAGTSAIWGSPAVLPVPEPGEWAMLLAGCGLLGLWTRRTPRRS